jgi:hypothetical protein
VLCVYSRSALLNSSTSTNPFEEDDPWNNSYAVGSATVVDDTMNVQQLRQQQQRIIDGKQTLKKSSTFESDQV